MDDYDAHQEHDELGHVASPSSIHDMVYEGSDRQGGLGQALGLDQYYDGSGLGQQNEPLENPPNINYTNILSLSNSPPSLRDRIDHWLKPEDFGYENPGKSELDERIKLGDYNPIDIQEAAQSLLAGGTMNQETYDSIGLRMPGGGFHAYGVGSGSEYRPYGYSSYRGWPSSGSQFFGPQYGSQWFSQQGGTPWLDPQSQAVVFSCLVCGARFSQDQHRQNHMQYAH